MSVCSNPGRNFLKKIPERIPIGIFQGIVEKKNSWANFKINL